MVNLLGQQKRKWSESSGVEGHPHNRQCEAQMLGIKACTRSALGDFPWSKRYYGVLIANEMSMFQKRFQKEVGLVWPKMPARERLSFFRYASLKNFVIIIDLFGSSSGFTKALQKASKVRCPVYQVDFCKSLKLFEAIRLPSILLPKN